MIKIIFSCFEICRSVLLYCYYKIKALECKYVVYVYESIENHNKVYENVLETQKKILSHNMGDTINLINNN